MSVHEAMFQEPLPDNHVRCTLCPHDCSIADGAKGACGIRINQQGKLYTLVYDRVIARHLEPVEKKPLFHFMPGSLAYSIATVGCNLHCSYCQNWDISQWGREHLPRKLKWATDDAPGIVCPQLEQLADDIPGEALAPQALVDEAKKYQASCIAYTYTEPTIFFELAYDTAVLARQQGLRNVFISNGFIAEEPLRQIAPVLDAINVDLKFFRDESYRKISRVRLDPILQAIRLYHELGVWVEVTTLVVPGLNDSDEELSEIARFIHSVDPEMPWHVSQFYPAYKMLDRPPTPVATLERALEIGKRAGLAYVYVGNVPGAQGESTYCPGCGEMLIHRRGLSMLENRIRGGACPDCQRLIAGVGMDGA